MFKAKRAITTCIMVFTLSAIAPAPSAMANWMVAGTNLTGTAALATTAAVDENFKLKAAGVTITCNGSTISFTNPQINAFDDMVDLNTLTFNSCIANEKCTVTKTIGTSVILVDVELLSPLHTRFLFLPKPGTLFTTIKYDGGECALLGVQPVTGKARMEGPTGADERTLQEIQAVVSEASGELKIGSSAAELKGAALLKLSNSAPWSFL
jgi:hypothetical protein